MGVKHQAQELRVTHQHFSLMSKCKSTFWWSVPRSIKGRTGQYQRTGSPNAVGPVSQYKLVKPGLVSKGRFCCSLKFSPLDTQLNTSRQSFMCFPKEELLTPTLGPYTHGVVLVWWAVTLSAAYVLGSSKPLSCWSIWDPRDLTGRGQWRLSLPLLCLNGTAAFGGSALSRAVSVQPNHIHMWNAETAWGVGTDLWGVPSPPWLSTQWCSLSWWMEDPCFVLE